jgi:hypothetical protein
MVATLIVSTAAARSWARPAPSSDLLEVLPDGNAVAVIDFQKLTGSSLWTAITAHQKLKDEIDKAQSAITDLGIKLSDVRSVALVFPRFSLDDPTVAVSGAFERSDLLARLRSNSNFKLASEKYNGHDIYRVKLAPPFFAPSKKAVAGVPATKSNEEMAFVFYDANTIVAGSTIGVRASVDVKTGAKPSVGKNEKLAAALAQNPDAAIQFGIVITPSMASRLQSSELPIPDFSSVNLIFGTIDVSSGVEINATLRSDSPEHAKSIAERLTGLLAMAKGYFGSTTDPKLAPIADALKTVSVTAADVDVKITGNVPPGLLNRILPAK